MSIVGLLGQNRLINTVATAAIRPTATLIGPAKATPPAAKNQVITPVNKQREYEWKYRGDYKKYHILLKTGSLDDANPEF